MASVRMTGNIQLVTKSKWLGTPVINADGHIERIAGVPEEVFQKIEQSIAHGSIEGIIFLDSQHRVEWFLDR